MNATTVKPNREEMMTMFQLSLQLLLTAPDDRYQEILDHANWMRDFCVANGASVDEIHQAMVLAAEEYHSS